MTGLYKGQEPHFPVHSSYFIRHSSAYFTSRKVNLVIGQEESEVNNLNYEQSTRMCEVRTWKYKLWIRSVKSPWEVRSMKYEI